MKFAKIFALAAALFITITSAGDALAQKTPKFTNVTSTVDVRSNMSEVSTIQGDGQGVYTHGTASVTSQIQPIGDWELDMFSSTARWAHVNPGPNVATTGQTAQGLAPAPGVFATRFLTQCTSYGPGLLAMVPNQTYQCGLTVGFRSTVQGNWTMRFHPLNGPSVHSQTAKVTCETTNASTGKCNKWTVSSGTVTTTDPETGIESTVPAKIKARLFKVESTKRSTTYVDYGLYEFSFSASFTAP
jgi:hypothetical protein